MGEGIERGEAERKGGTEAEERIKFKWSTHFIVA